MRSRNKVEPRLSLWQKDGVYFVRVTWPDGKRQAYSLKTRDQSEAEGKLRVFRSMVLPELVESWVQTQAAAEATPEPSQAELDASPRLRDIVDYYVGVALPNRAAAPKTIEGSDHKLWDFTGYCSLRHVGRVSQLSRRILDDYVAELRGRGLSAKTIATYLATIRAAFNAAVEGERIEVNPFARMSLPKTPDPEIHPLTVEQLREVLTIIDRREPRIAPVVHWIAYTGNRPSDAVALAWRQVRLADRIVERTQQKSRRLAQYQISERAAALLEAQPRTGPLVFPDSDGDVMRINMLYRRFTRGLERAGFERAVNLKDLRHTFCSLLANGDPPCPLPVLQALAGHADIKTTMRYVHAGDGFAYVNALGTAIGDGG